MAATVVSIEYLDSIGASGRETIKFPDTYTFAQVNDWLTNGGLAAIDGVTAAQILSVRILLELDISGLGLAGAPATNSRYHVGATFGFRDGDGVADSLWVPAISNAHASGGDVNVTAEVQTFIDAAIQPGINDGTNDNSLSSRSGSEYVTFRGVDLVSRDI